MDDWFLIKDPNTVSKDNVEGFFELYADSGWAVLAPPLEVVSDELFEDIQSMSMKRIEEIAINSGFPRKQRREFYLKIVNSSDAFSTNLKGTGGDELACPIEVANQIRKDVERTHPENYPDSKEFRNRLEKLLKKFASTHPNIGFCQGMSYIGSVLIQLNFSDEEAFKIFRFIINRRTTDFYIPSLAGMHTKVQRVEKILKIQDPLLTAKLEELKIPVLWLCVEPMLCLWSRTFPLHSVLRLWDFMLVKGEDAIALLSAAFILMNRNIFMTEISNREPGNHEDHAREEEEPCLSAVVEFQRQNQIIASSKINDVIKISQQLVNS
jgi:Rab-GTPase-TBC domain